MLCRSHLFLVRSIGYLYCIVLVVRSIAQHLFVDGVAFLPLVVELGRTHHSSNLYGVQHIVEEEIVSCEMNVMVQATTSITTTTTTTTTDGDGIGTEKRNVVTSPEASAKTRLLPLSSLLLTEDSDSPNQRRTVQQQQQQRQHEQVAFDNGITISVAWTTPERGPAGATEGNATTATTVNTFFPSASPTAVTGSAIGTTTQFQPTSTTTPTTTTPPRSGAIVMDKDMHTIVVGVLIALIVILCIVLGLLVLPWIRIYLRRRASNDKRRMQRRYKTVDWWLITKVRHVLCCVLFY